MLSPRVYRGGASGPQPLHRAVHKVVGQCWRGAPTLRQTLLLEQEGMMDLAAGKVN